MPTYKPTYKLKKSFKLLTALLISSLSVFSLVPYEARAAAGIYGRLNFQGKVVNSDGTNVSDGTYDFVFKIYDGAGSGASTLWTESWTAAALWSSTMSSAPGSGGESLIYVSDTNESTLKVGQTLWNTTKEEAATVTSVDTGGNTLGISPTRQAWVVSDTVTNKIYVKDGIFSVQLNSLNDSWSSVDWNSDSLFLGVSFNSDGEMKPRKRLTAVPYAHNANLLGGLSSGSLLRSDASDNYTSGTLTLDAGTILDVNGALALGGATILESLDMANNIITNIGNAGTGFDSFGSLTLAGDLLLDKIGTATVSVTEYPSNDLIFRGSGWKPAAADFRKKITIDHTKVDGNLTDFPLLINLSSDADLASLAQDDGDDIYFTEDDGVTKLDHEIEKYVSATGELVAHVRIPALSSTVNTEIYMYYGNLGASNQENVTGVWHGDFRMVQHLGESSGTHYDSTINNNDGIPYNGVIQDVAGKIDGADGFDGANDYIDMGNNSSLNVAGNITLETWFKADQLGGSYQNWLTDNFFEETKIATSTNITVDTGAGQVKLSEIPFSCGDTLVDSRDSKEYDTVQIGDQCWMAEHINVGTMTAGTNNQGSDCPSAAEIGKYCYSDTEGNCTTDGALYQWAQAMCGAVSCNGTGESQPACTSPVQGICPGGWHIPSHYEYTALEREVCDSGTCVADFPYNESTTGWRGTDEGTQLKVGGSSGFEGLLAGYRRTVGSFINRGTYGYFWSSSESGSSAWRRYLGSAATTVYRDANLEAQGFSVRCVKD